MAGTLSLPTLSQKVKIDLSDTESAAARLQGTMGKASGAVRGFGRDAKTATTDATRGFNGMGLASAAAGAGIVIALKKAIEAASSYASEIRKLKAVTGASAEDSSKLAFVFGRLGLDTDAVTRGFVIFSRALESNKPILAKYFTDAELATLRSQSLAASIPLLEAKFQSLASPLARNAFLIDNFGRGGLAMRRLLSLLPADFEKLTAQAAAFGLILTDNNIEAFKKFDESGRTVGQAMKGLEVQIGLQLIPTMEKFEGATTFVLTSLEAIPGPIRQVVIGAAALTLSLGLLGAAATFAGGGLAKLGISGVLSAAVSGFGALGDAVALAAFDFAALDVAGLVSGIATLGGALGGLLLAAAPLLLIVAGLAGIIFTLHERQKQAAEAAKTMDDQLAHNAIHFTQLHLSAEQASSSITAYQQGLEDAKASGVKLNVIQDRITSGFDLIARTARLGGDVRKVTDDIAEGHLKAARALATRAAAQEFQTHVEQEAEAESKRHIESILDGIKTTQDAARAEADFGNAITAHGIASAAGQTDVANYTKSLIEQKQAEIDAAKATDEAKGTNEATAKVYGEIEAQVQKVIDAQNKLTEQNLKTIASFSAINVEGVSSAKELDAAQQKVQDATDRVAKVQERVPKTAKDAADKTRDLAKANRELGDAQKDLADKGGSALQKFLDTTAGNAKIFAGFIGNVNLLFRKGAPALAKELLDLGPAGAAAAAEAVGRIGSKEGLGKLEQTAEDAVKAAKTRADAGLALWQPNFQGMGAAAGNALGTGIQSTTGGIIASLKNALGETVTVGQDANGKLAAIVATAGGLKTIDLSNLTGSVDALATALGISKDAAILLLARLKDIERARAIANSIASAFGAGTPFHQGGLVMHAGGPVPRMHAGGSAGLRGDEVPAILQRREFVFSRRAVDFWGLDLLAAMNRLHDGGPVPNATSSGNQASGFVEEHLHVHAEGPIFGVSGVREFGALAARAIEEHRRARAGM